MNFISKLIARPKSLIASSDDMEQTPVLVSPVNTATPSSAQSQTQEATIEELLVQINDNLTNQTSVALSGGNQKQLATKATTPNNKQQQDFKQVGAAANHVGFNRSSNESLSENISNKSEKRSVGFAGSKETSIDSVSIDLPVGILKPFNIVGQSVSSLEDSLVSSLAANLDSVLRVSTPDEFNRSKSLSVPLESESSGSHVSSDNETYVECRSFSPSEESNRFTSALDLVSIADPSLGWEDLVTSVSEMDIDSLENINEQLDGQLDMTPTDSNSNLGILNLADDAKIEPSIIISQDGDPTVCPKSEQTPIENEENAHLDLTSCMLPEAVANLIENVDANSCDNTNDDLEKCQELQIVPTTIEDLNRSQRSVSSDLNRTIEGTDKEYFNNVTLEADKAFALQNKSVSLADIINEPNTNNSIVLSWAKVEQTVEELSANNSSQKEANETQELLSFSLTQGSEDVNIEEKNCENQCNITQELSGSSSSQHVDDVCSEKILSRTVDSENEKSTEPLQEGSVSPAVQELSVENAGEISENKSENEANLTLELDCHPSSLQIDDFNPDQPLPETPSDKLSLNLQFPVKTTRDKSSFPHSPTQENLSSDFSKVDEEQIKSQTSTEVKTDECSEFNKTIEILATSPKETKTNDPKEVNGLNNPSNVTINLKDLSPTATFVDETNTMDSTFSAPKIKSPNALDQTFNGGELNQVNNETIVMENVPEVANETVTYEPMDVDVEMKSPNPNETVSYQTDALPSTLSSESLSEKEKCDTLNEKDVFVEKCASNYQTEVDDMFKVPKCLGFPGQKDVQPSDLAADEDFQSNRIFLNPSDFDFLLTKGNSNGVEGDRSSLLLRFDPLLGHSVPVNLPVKAGSSTLLSSSSTLSAAAASSSASSWSSDRQQHQQQHQEFNIQNRLSPANEEEEHFYDSNRSFQLENGLTQTKPEEPPAIEPRRQQQQKQKPIQITARSLKKNVKMSVDVMQDMKIENDSKSIEEIDTQTDIKQNFKMDELEKKIKNEVLKTEDIEKKLKEAEQREEALIKRITEKDKAIAKMNGVIEAYEKAIAELISEKEHILQNYEKQLTEVKADRDSNYHHLTSLETTFSDLHVKYEKSKEMTAQLKSSEEALLAEKRQNLENLRLQEQRYEKMKNHAMQQLEIANKKLESLTKNHSMEITKLKALLKKEEISRASMTEQLQQKTRENEELVKICDELINGQGS
ncbi:transforming acidic coiled-coil-containing protein 2 isoform X2 [Episyrphus balteatus]|uniref:transforming acidic coiled-coil-containing protein 2 isoform X2 n=1 Tax=Episyrphus balteatus TaxID=286459 RepID=UPI002485F0D4|nr:transforming acidic coiled-coil-containing protein 2 isoform X2 [Episyrphus balteatus]